MFKAIHGHDTPHPAIATSLNNLGSVFEELGELDKALEKLEQSLVMRIAIHGHETPHPAIITSLYNLGAIYGKLGKLDEALEKREQSLATWLALARYRDIVTEYWNRASRAKALKRASVFLEQSLAMLRIVYAGNSQHLHIKDLQCHLAKVHEELG